MSEEGSSDERAKLDAFFEPVAGVITGFAATHGVAIDKYWNGTRSWWLRFRRPGGGSGNIEVGKAGDGITVRAACWRDDYDARTRSIKNFEEHALGRDPEKLMDRLKATLKEVVAWRPGEWSEVITGIDEWEVMSKEELEKIEQTDPLADISDL